MRDTSIRPESPSRRGTPLGARPDEIQEWFGAEAGSLGPVGVTNMPILADKALDGRRNMIAGANRDDHHLRHVTPGEDFEAELEDLTGPGQFARTMMRALGHSPSKDEAKRWGRVAHVAFGTAVALAYPTLARRWPWLRAGNGMRYGLLVYPGNALVVPALGLTPPSWKFPKETILRGLGYHLAYGFALESLARMMRLHDEPSSP